MRAYGHQSGQSVKEEVIDSGMGTYCVISEGEFDLPGELVGTV